MGMIRLQQRPDQADYLECLKNSVKTDKFSEPATFPGPIRGTRQNLAGNSLKSRQHDQATPKKPAIKPAILPVAGSLPGQTQVFRRYSVTDQERGSSALLRSSDTLQTYEELLEN